MSGSAGDDGGQVADSSLEEELGTGSAVAGATGLHIHTFAGKYVEMVVHGQVLLMKDSFFLWLGLAPPQLDNLSVALTSRLDSEPSTTVLMGNAKDDEDDGFVQELSRRLAQRTGMVAFVSYNLPLQADDIMERFVMQLVFQELKKCLEG